MAYKYFGEILSSAVGGVVTSLFRKTGAGVLFVPARIWKTAAAAAAGNSGARKPIRRAPRRRRPGTGDGGPGVRAGRTELK